MINRNNAYFEIKNFKILFLSFLSSFPSLPLNNATTNNSVIVIFFLLSSFFAFINIPTVISHYANATTTTLAISTTNTSSIIGESIQQNQQDLQAAIKSQIGPTFTEAIKSLDRDEDQLLQNSTHIQQNLLIIKILAQNLENHIYKAGSILEITSKLPQVRDVPYAHLLNQTIYILHGIPEYADIEKRQVARDIISSNSDFYEVGFFISNGDFYISEPYSEQQISNISNIAFRDYFKGAIKTNDTYLGNVITSKDVLGVSQAVIAVPVYSLEDNSTIVGIWAGGLDFDVFNNDLQSFNLTTLLKEESPRVVYVDSNGEKIADSDISKRSIQESFATLQSFMESMNGKSGSVMDIVYNKKMLVSYHPVKVYNNIWSVLLMQPTNTTIN